MNMDWNSLKEQAANLTLYDVKKAVRKGQAMVMNYTETEQWVREATNNEPWGAASSDLNRIAQATFNYQQLNEIMPLIYSRFTQKSQEEWRQIYKALQLLEYLIKNGSERVIDDARSHLTLLKMLRQFHYIDPNGKDQGINVRNRAKELTELLSDVERIRAERKKARANRNKYGGVEGGAGLGGGSMSSDSRFGGFGSESGQYGGYSGGVFGDGGGFGGQSSEYQEGGGSSSGGRGADKFDEYDEYDEGAVAAPGHRQADASSSRTTSTRRTERAAAKKPEPKKKEPEVDLFSFDEPAVSSSAATGSAPSAAADDDEFDDFQSAAPAPATSGLQSVLSPPPATTSTTTPLTQFAAPQPVSAPKAANLSNMTAFSSLSPNTSTTATPVNYSAFSPPAAAQQQAKPVAYQGSQPNYFTSVPVPSSQPAQAVASTGAKPAAAKPSGDAFGSLWSTASVGVKKANTPSQGPALGQLAKEKASAGIWGTSGSTNVMTHPTQQGASEPVTAKTGKEPKWMDDLLG